jgi:hypothetical protein
MMEETPGSREADIRDGKLLGKDADADAEAEGYTRSGKYLPTWV